MTDIRISPERLAEIKRAGELRAASNLLITAFSMLRATDMSPAEIDAFAAQAVAMQFGRGEEGVE